MKTKTQSAIHDCGLDCPKALVDKCLFHLDSWTTWMWS